MVPEAELEEMRRLGMLGYADGYQEVDLDGELGARVLDAERVQAGANLYTSGHEARAYLVGLDGAALHEWTVDREAIEGASQDVESLARLWRRVVLLEDGALVAVHEGLGLVCVERDSSVRWYVENGAHHDLCLTPQGTLLALTRQPAMLPALSRQPLLEDFAVELDVATGRELNRTSILQALWVPAWTTLLTEATRNGGDALHPNSIAVLTEETAGGHPALRAGTLIVCLRDLDAIVGIDPVRRNAVWLQQGAWRRPHDARPQPGGTILLFDNMGNDGHSRVLELDPGSGDLAWQWAPADAADFFSVFCGAARRLPNGNTLVTESCAGRAFELAPGGDIVWRFDSPHRAGDQAHLVAVLYEVLRVERPAWLEPR